MTSVEPLPAAVWDSVRDPARRRVLAGLAVPDSADADFERLARLAATMFGAPIAAVSLIDAERQWFVAKVGLDFPETPVRNSLGAHALAAEGDSFIVTDAAADPRFTAVPGVAGAPFIRFYAAAPIVVQGYRLGLLAVASPQARAEVEAGLLEQLVALADTAGALFSLKNEAKVRARTAADLIREEWRHALTLEAGQVGSWVWNIRSGEVVANDILRRMFGIEGTPTIDDIFAAVEPGHLSSMQQALDASFERGADYMTEFRLASGRWLIGRGRVYQRDAAGKPLIMMGVNIDVTEAREAAEHTRLLLRELNHRVKNTLAMIQSLARQTLRQSPDPQHFIDAFSGRLRTLSEAHVLLAERDWSGIGLVELVQAEVGAYVLADAGRLVVDGEDVRLPPDHALGLALILHELATNAVRFGALSGRSGTVTIAWRREAAPAPQIRLSWKESGGPPVVAPGSPGFGTRLIEHSLDKILDSQVSLAFPADGVEAHVLLPLP